MSFKIFSTYSAAQRKGIAVKAFMEFLNRCKDLTGIFTAVMSLLLAGGVGGYYMKANHTISTDGQAKSQYFPHSSIIFAIQSAR